MNIHSLAFTPSFTPSFTSSFTPALTTSSKPTSRASVFSWFLRLLTAGFLITLVLLNTGCGGGGAGNTAANGNGGGVGSGGSGIAEGAITGFGSVVVDGVTYQDIDAKIITEMPDGTTQLVPAKLGQRVRLTLKNTATTASGANGVADQILVLPQLRGIASTAQDADGWFQMLGSWVRVIATSDTQNTATVLDGLSAVTANLALEIHGSWTFDSTKGASVLIATRIEKLTSAPNPLLISGVVRSRTGNAVILDNHASQRITLQGANLPASIAAESLVTAWLSNNTFPGAPSVSPSNSPLQVSRLLDASPQTVADSDKSLLIGTKISERDTANGTVMVQGMRVKLPDDIRNAPPEIGESVQVEVVREGDEWKIKTLKRRTQSNNNMGEVVSLKGSLLWPAQTDTLILRGVAVNTPPSVFSPSCTTVREGDSVYLDITAQRQAPGQPLRATQVICTQQIPTSAVIEIKGQLRSVVPDVGSNNTSGTVQVVTRSGTQSFRWTSNSRLPFNLQSQIGQTVELEYQVIGTENRIRKLDIDD